MRIHVICLLTVTLALCVTTSKPSKFTPPSVMSNSEKDLLRHKLIRLYNGETRESLEGLIRLLMYLNDEEIKYKGQGEDSPIWRTLNVSQDSEVFKVFADTLIQDARKAQKDDKLHEFIARIYDTLLSPATKESSDMDEWLNVESGKIKMEDWDPLAVSAGLLNSLEPADMEKVEVLIVELSKTFAWPSGTASATATKISVPLAGLYVSYHSYRNIDDWWNGRMSGKRCAKNIADTVISSAAGVVGCTYGAAYGSMYGPVGAIVGGAVGGISAAMAADYLSDHLTRNLFGLPKDKALENAYFHLGVDLTASNHEINQQFRKLSFESYNSGNTEEFHMLQSMMAMIKISRGEV